MRFVSSISLTLAINVLALALPLSLLQIYDRILPNQAIGTAVVILSVAGLAVLLGAFFRFLRSEIYLRKGGEEEYRLWMRVAGWLLAPVSSATTSRHKRQEILSAPARAKEVAVGQTLLPLFDAPFAVVFLGLVWFLGGDVVLAPLAVAVVGSLVVLIGTPGYRSSLGAAADAQAEVQASFLSLAERTGAGAQFADLAGDMAQMSGARRAQAAAEEKTEAFQNLLLDVTQVASLATLGAVLALGAHAVLDGDMTSGGLAACTLLGTRGVIQLIGSAAAIARRQGSLAAASALAPVSAQVPHEETQETDGPIGLEGSVVGQKVSVPAGGIAVFDAGDTSASGAAFVELARALFENGEAQVQLSTAAGPVSASQAGSRLRFLPARPHLFKGSLAENLSRFDPDDVAEALQLAEALGLDRMAGLLADGYDAEVEAARARLSDGAVKRAALVRTLVGDPGLVLLQRPEIGLDADGIARLVEALSELRGRVSVLMVTENADLRALANGGAGK